MNHVAEAQILWRRLDQPGHDHCRLWDNRDAFVLTGTAIFADGGAPCRLDYQVFCDRQWRTHSGSVVGWCGGKEVRLEILALGQQRWQLNGAEVPEVHGCVDLDLGFTPATNLLSLRRLGLEVGGEAPVRAAWLELPQFALAAFGAAVSTNLGRSLSLRICVGRVPRRTSGQQRGLRARLSGLVDGRGGRCRRPASTGR